MWLNRAVSHKFSHELWLVRQKKKVERRVSRFALQGATAPPVANIFLLFAEDRLNHNQSSIPESTTHTQPSTCLVSRRRARRVPPKTTLPVTRPSASFRSAFPTSESSASGRVFTRASLATRRRS